MQFLLHDNQTRFENGADEFYIESASLVQNPQGLAALGTVSIAWQPDRQDLVIHKLHLIRDGEIIDILANGQEFAILRRENNLEQATLDGVLTAVIQPEGMEVGDILNVAYSYRMRAGEIDFGSEDFYYLAQGLPTRHLRYRQIWPSGMNMRWQASEAMGEPRSRETADGTELTLELLDREAPEVPENAPARFTFAATFQLTDYESWNAVGTLFAPYYEDARSLAEDSSLRAEIERIAASTSDPRERVMAALQLVQDRVRYVALAMGDSGYVPASADQTWRRRYGDCKGKTALLLAMLDALGIEGVPALVSTGWGDGLDQRLPQVALFDHVIVRIEIDGQTYWLDGTQMGDRDIEALRYSPYRWALPVRSENSELEPLPPVSPPRPLLETRVVYDASNGFSSEVPVNGAVVFRGSLAQMMLMAVGQVGDEQLQQLVRESFAEVGENQTITEITVGDDQNVGEFSISFTGTSLMEWRAGAGRNNLRFEFDDEIIDWDVSFERDNPEHADLPFGMAFPAYMATEEIVILPNGGEGFTLAGDDINEIVAGTQIARTASIENGRAVARSSFRRLEFEVAAERARADFDTIEAIKADQAYIVAPSDYQISEAEIAQILEGEADSANDHIRRGFHLMGAGRQDEAVAAYDAAIALEPDNAAAHANRGIALIQLNRTDEAEISLDRAESLDATDFVVKQGLGMLHFSRGEYEEAIAAFAESLDTNPGNAYSLFALLSAYQRTGQLGDALDTIDTIVEAEGDSPEMSGLRARILLHLGDEAGAVSVIEQITVPEGDPLSAYLTRAGILRRAGRDAEARAEYGRALASVVEDRAEDPSDQMLLIAHAQILDDIGDAPQAVSILSRAIEEDGQNANLLNQRCWTRLTANIEILEALNDCAQAVEFAPENAAILDSLAWAKLRLGRWGEAIDDFDAALALAPGLASSLFGRAIAKERSGDFEGARVDLAEARRNAFDIDAEYGPWLGDLTPGDIAQP
ncbi:MAG: tetratricopeptide repeat protein [Parasphingopyxis sp.]|uniref:tetratricopeptide repeat protein n=1 Tax=Parasphingopyxis sp. TaxID=1920299 RepID=UPI003F9FFCDE